MSDFTPRFNRQRGAFDGDDRPGPASSLRHSRSPEPSPFGRSMPYHAAANRRGGHMGESYDAIIIGAGIIGACTALEL